MVERRRQLLGECFHKFPTALYFGEIKDTVVDFYYLLKYTHLEVSPYIMNPEQSSPPAGKFDDREVVLEASHISKRFPGVLANDDVNLKLHRGEILALLGENGAGKSTLMNIIYGLYHQDEGTISLKGQEVRFTSPREAIHSGIGMVHQHFQLVDVMTVGENVVLGEEREKPNWRSLLGVGFAGLFGAGLVAFAASQEIIYDALIFLLLAILLPWFVASVAVNVVRDLLLQDEDGNLKIPAERMRQGRRWTVFAFQFIAILILVGISRDFDDTAKFLTGFGMVVIGGLAYGAGLALAPLVYDRLSALRQTPLTSENNQNHGLNTVRWSLFSSLALTLYGLWFLVNMTSLADIATLVGILLLLTAISIVGGIIIAIALGYVFRHWAPVTAGLRVVWGVAWRIGLIVAVFYLGGQIERATRMGLITAILQNDAPFSYEVTNTTGDFTLRLAAEPAGEIPPPPNRGDIRLTYEPVLNDAGEVVYTNVDNRAIGRSAASASHLYTFNGNAGDVVTITMHRDNVDDVLDPYLQLIGPDGEVLVENDDDPAGALPRDAGIREYTLPESGFYNIVATNYSTIVSEGPYVFAVEGAAEVEPSWRSIEREENVDDQITALLAEIDEEFAHEQTIIDEGENAIAQAEVSGARGYDPRLRQAVEDVPPVVHDIAIGLLMILVVVIALRSWRGWYRFPTQLNALDLFIMAALSLIFFWQLFEAQQDVNDSIRIGFVIAGLAVSALTIFLTYQGRQREQERIRPIFPLDTAADAFSDSVYTVLSVRHPEQAAQQVHDLSMRYGLEVDPSAMVEKLPVGNQQRVEIIKALYRQADILILDEPTAVLTPQEGRELFKIMRELSAQGVSIIFITHKLKEVFEVATNIVVMRGGRVVGTTTPQEATETSLAAMMVGREVMLKVDKTEATPQETVLHVEGLQATDDRGALALDGVSFEVKAGEVLGIAGVQGNGQTELVEVLTGLRPMEEGAVELLGQELKPKRQPDAQPLTRFLAGVIDLVLVFILAALIAYFQAYFSGEDESFTLFSLLPLLIFIGTDAVYTLGSWQFWGATLGKSLLGLQIRPIDNSEQVPFVALAQRYVIQTVLRYSVIGIILALVDAAQRPDQRTRYDELPTINTRVVHQLFITPRRIKDLNTGHVPEDRLRYGLVKPFTVSENLVLNDYYEPPYAEPPTLTQLPFLGALYAMSFGAAFAVMAYLWYFGWTRTLWTELLDSFDVPGYLRNIPLQEAMGTLQKAYLDDPLVLSLVILLSFSLVFSIIAHLLSRVVTSLFYQPLNVFQLFVGTFAGLVTFFGGDALLGELLDINSNLQSALAAGLALLLVIIAGVAYRGLVANRQPEAEREKLTSGGVILNLSGTASRASELIERYDIRTPSTQTSGGSLSGGNQQKLVVAREFSHKPRLLIAAQPTRGIDVGSIEFIHQQIVAQRDEGAAVLLVSAELDEIMSISDRIAVMYKGQIIRTVDAKTATREELGLLMAGITDRTTGSVVEPGMD